MPPCPALYHTVDATHDPGLIASPAGDILHVNASAQRLFERGRRDHISRRTVFSFFSLIATSLDDVEEYGPNGKRKPRGKLAKDTWAAVVRNLREKFVTREATGYRTDGSTFPAGVNMFKVGGSSCGGGGSGDGSMNEDRDPAGEAGANGNGKASGKNDGEDDDSYVCVFVKDTAHDRLLAELESQLRDLDAENLRLRRSQDALVVASGDSTIIVDEEGTIHSLDEVTQRTFGYSEGELVGRNISVLMGRDHAAKHDSYIKRYLKTGERRVMGKRRELQARRSDGTVFPIELGVAEIMTDPWERRMFAGMICDISSRRAAFMMLERSERLRDAILDANKDAMFSLSPRGKIETVNKAATTMFGWETEELKGKHITCLVADEDVEAVRDDLVNGGLSPFASPSAAPSRVGSTVGDEESADDSSVATSGSRHPIAVDHELTGLRRDGSTFPIALDLARISSRSVPGKTRPCAAFVRDLTKQKADEAELAHRMAVNEAVLDASFDSIFLIDERGLIEVVNRAAEMQFGWSREEFLGKNIAMICGGVHGTNHDRYMRRYLETGRTGVMGKRRILPARKKDGSEFKIELGLVEIRTVSMPGATAAAVRGAMLERKDSTASSASSQGGGGRKFCAFVRDVSDRGATAAAGRGGTLQ